MLYKFAPCTNANAIVPEAGFPVQVATVNDNICPVSGLDRCNAGTIAPSLMVVVDDTNPSHVYVAFASTSLIGNDDIWVFDSTNGGANFARSVKVSPTVPAHRFLPWVCATGGAAIVSWYDRSRATAQRNDLTDYLVASASVQGGMLTSGPAVNVSQNSDPQCATGFPCGADVDDKPAVACVPPQISGRCRNAQQPAASSNQACSIVRGTVCPNLGETCQLAGNGCPKYGDYNGNACGGGYIYTAWASATSPAGIPAVNGIAIFSTTLTQTLTLNTVVVGGAGLFDLQIDGFNQAVDVGNGGSTGPKVVSIGTHTIGEIAGFGTSASNYSVTIGGDCSPNGTINITLGDHKTCTLTNTKISLESCLQQCLDEYADCVEGGDLIGGGSVAKCRPILARCRASCRRR